MRFVKQYNNSIHNNYLNKNNYIQSYINESNKHTKNKIEVNNIITDKQYNIIHKEEYLKERALILQNKHTCIKTLFPEYEYTFSEDMMDNIIYIYQNYAGDILDGSSSIKFRKRVDDLFNNYNVPDYVINWIYVILKKRRVL